MGEGYGPKLVARQPVTIESLNGRTPRVAIPGRRTTAALTLGLRLRGIDWTPVEVPFDTVPDVVLAGDVDAGVVIHEGQLTYADDGLHLVEDLGAWWTERTGGPLPLGLNLVRRDLEDLHGPGTLVEIAGLLEASVRHALEHRSTSIEYAMRFGRGIPAEVADRFVELYVNRLTIDAGESGRDAIRRLFAEAAEADLLPVAEEVSFLRGG